MDIQKIKDSFDKKLAAYGALGIGLLALPQIGDAQILFTDIYPDLQLGDTNSFIANINDDKYHDYMVFQGFSATANMVMVQLADSCELIGSVAGNYLYPLALDAGYMLNNGNSNWNFNHFGTMNYAGENNYGNWAGAVDKYLGMKLILKGKPYFGYMRLDVGTDAKSFVIKDFAFDFTSGKTVTTGEAIQTYAASALEVIAETKNAKSSDLRVKFKRAADESKISEYRLIFVKVSDSLLFSPSAAMNVPTGNYKVFPKKGADFNELLPDNVKDQAGNLVKNGIQYKIYVLSVPDGVNATEPILMWNGKAFMYVITSSPAGKPLVSDIGDMGNGLDMKVSFTKAPDENKVGKYRIFVVKSSKAASFTIEQAKGLGPMYFYELDKTGSDQNTVLTSTTKDSDGDAVKDDVPYKVFVISLADGTYSSVNAISEASEEIILKNTSFIREEDAANLIDFYVNGKTIYVTNVKFVEGVMEIIDINGRIIYHQQIVNEYFEIHLDHVKEGIYVMKLRNQQGSHSCKIIVH